MTQVISVLCPSSCYNVLETAAAEESALLQHSCKYDWEVMNCCEGIMVSLFVSFGAFSLLLFSFLWVSSTRWVSWQGLCDCHVLLTFCELPTAALV